MSVQVVIGVPTGVIVVQGGAAECRACGVARDRITAARRAARGESGGPAHRRRPDTRDTKWVLLGHRGEPCAMLLCSLADLEPGMEVGATVLHPQRPTVELLRPGVKLEPGMIRQLERLGVTELWVQHAATRDLDAAVASNLTEAQAAIYERLQGDFHTLATRTVSIAHIQNYREAISGLVFELLANGKYAHLGHTMLRAPGELFAHASSVAFLSVLVGLELNAYVVRQRRRLTYRHARDVIPLGIGAMLHDVGKMGLSEPARRHHEIHPDPEDPAVAEEYRSHVRAGYDLLYDTGIAASARNIVLNHHQRFNGRGWPVQSRTGTGAERGLLERDGIHVFSRIVAAANTLDNLLTDAEGRSYPPVAALREFASSRFDGWFDPTVRDLMVRRIPPFPIGSLIKLSDGRAAVIVTPNFDHPCRPVVRLLDEGSEHEDGEHRTLDLADAPPGLFVRECAGRRVDEYLFELPPRAQRWTSLWSDHTPPAA